MDKKVNIQSGEAYVVMVWILECQYLIGGFESLPQSDAHKQSTGSPRISPVLINDGQLLVSRCLLNNGREYFSGEK